MTKSEQFDLRTWKGNFVNAKQLASFVECDARIIAAMVNNGELEGTKAGRAYKIPTDAALRKFHVQQTPASKAS